MIYRQFAPGTYEGTRVDLNSLKRKQEREKLVGKRIGYDQRGSCMMHYGRVTETRGQSLFVDGNAMDLYQFDQIVILDDQGDTNAEA